MPLNIAIDLLRDQINIEASIFYNQFMVKILEA